MTTNKTVLSTIKKDHHIEKVDLKAYSKNDLESINIIVKKAVIDSSAPRTPEELWNCIKINFGIEIPLTSTSEEFNAPFEWLWNFWTERHESSFAVGPRGGLKCLATTTPILTHNRGWITTGEVVVGDYVYDINGNPTKVLEISDVHYDKECYSVNFNKAEPIVCSGDHLWKTWTKENRSKRKKSKSGRKAWNSTVPSIKTTEEIFNTQYVGKARESKGYTCKPEVNHSIPIAKLNLVEQELKMDPYILGLWLGDGAAGLSAYTSADAELVEALRKTYVVDHRDRYDYVVRGLSTDLRKLGFTKHGPKSIPKEYLIGSYEQQLALVQGLMDTDGSVSTEKQMQYFSNTCRALIDGLYALLTNIGVPSTITPMTIEVNGLPYHYWTISFSTDVPMFRLQRKLDIQRSNTERRVKAPKADHHFIHSVEKVATVPTVCILIEHPEHLFLAGRSLVPTHNTYPSTIMTYLFSRYRKDYESITAGALKKHSAVSQKYLRGFFKDPSLKPYFSKAPTATSAEWVTGSTWSIVTGTTSGISGDHPQLLCMDEIEFWPIDAIGQALSLPITKGDNKAQLHMFSTRQKSFGSSNWLTTQIESGEKDIKLYSWSIFEVMQPCKSCLCIKGGRTISEPEKTCILWDDCRGVKGMKSTGIYTREYVCKKKKDLTPEEWETQYLCLRPSSHGLVLYNFSHEEMAPGDINKGNYCAWEYLPDQPYYIIHDPAEGHKSVMIFVQFWNDRMFIFDEIIDKESYSITKCKVQLQERIKEMGYAYPEFIIPDPHRTDAGKEWTDGSPSGTGSGRSYKVQYPKMEGDYKNIEPGIDLLRTAILNGSGKRSLYINKKNCPGIIDAVREHHYKTGMDNSLSDAAKPDAAFKDEVDTMRYGVIWAKQRRLMFIREQTAMIRSLG